MQPKILIVDDEMEFTKALEQYFGARGYEVHVALTGSSGIALVDHYNPDVVLTDLKLPGLDGDDILKHVRRTHPNTKVIVITAYNDGGKAKRRLLALGAFAHFDKPLPSLQDLGQTIQRALASSGGPDATKP